MADKTNLDTARLLDWLEGKLSTEESDALAEQVAATPGLREQVDWLQQFLQLSRTTTLANPPVEVRRAATAAFQAYAQAKRPPGRLQVLFATLTADNRQRPATAGARHAGLQSGARQLIYSSERADIALNIYPRPGGGTIDLDGQILLLDDGDPSDFIIQLLQDGRERRLALTDDLGKFSLADLSAGYYDLVAGDAGTEITIDALDLT